MANAEDVPATIFKFTDFGEICFTVGGNENNAQLFIDAKGLLKVDIVAGVTIHENGGGKFKFKASPAVKTLIIEEDTDLSCSITTSRLDVSNVELVGATLSTTTASSYVLHKEHPIFTKDTRTYIVVVVQTDTDPDPVTKYLIDCTEYVLEKEKDNIDKKQELAATSGGTRKRRASKKKRKAKTPKRRKHAKRS
tara:strand:+ start:976 stop:1557 length:582 start_codon:yes stop_codon:yes gene_type:complete